MHRISLAILLLFFQITHLSAMNDLLNLPVNLGMERAEVEEILRAPLFSYAKVFHPRSGQASPAVAYALYKVPEWDETLPSYILAFFFEGFVMRLVGIYQDTSYQKMAWAIANQPQIRAGRHGNVEYYVHKDYLAYYLLQRVRPNDKNSLLNSQIKDLIFQATAMPYFYIIFYHDQAMFELLYQSVKDLNLFSEIFKDLMKKPPMDNQEPGDDEGQAVPPDYPENRVPGADLPGLREMPEEKGEMAE